MTHYITTKSTILALLLGCVLNVADAASDTTTVAALWQPYQIKYTHRSVVTYYTCQGIENGVRLLLRHIGARDINVHVRPCFDNESTQRSYQLRLDFTALTETDADNSSAIAASWQDSTINRSTPNYLLNGDCELVEWFVKKVVPELNYPITPTAVRCDASNSAIGGVYRLQTLRSITPDA